MWILKSTPESGEGMINGSASPFLHTYVEDDEEESDFDEDDIQVPDDRKLYPMQGVHCGLTVDFVGIISEVPPVSPIYPVY